VSAFVVDTNVLAVANRKAPQASPLCVKVCADYLRSIERGHLLVLDDGWRIIREYERLASSTGQPGLGDRFLKWVLRNLTNSCRCERVSLTLRSDDADDFEQFPDDPDLVGFDRADRKFAAVARTSLQSPIVLNATDSDWWD
jgi:hypothetical protein